MATSAAFIEWAGVRFLPLDHHDGRFFRGPGLYGFARREPGGERTLLYVDHADNIAQAATSGTRMWSAAFGLGMNELHLNVAVRERLDRLQLKDRVVRHVGPVLNDRKSALDYASDALAACPFEEQSSHRNLIQVCEVR